MKPGFLEAFTVWVVGGFGLGFVCVLVGGFNVDALSFLLVKMSFKFFLMNFHTISYR